MPEHVYNIYLRAWGDIDLSQADSAAEINRAAEPGMATLNYPAFFTTKMVNQMALKPPDDQFTDKDLRQMQYNRCSADWAALDSDMWQIPTLLIAVNTLILAVAFEYIKNNLPIRIILLLFATVWSIFLILGFLRIHATQLHRSAFMLEIEKKATGDAHLSTPLLEVETHKMLKWLQDWHPADEPKPRTPGKPERWLIENAGKSAGLVLGAIIVLADLLLFAWTVLGYLLVVPQL